MEHDENVDLLLREVCKAHTKKVNQVLSRVNLHKGQPMLLSLLCRRDGLPQSMLAKELLITPATVSAMVKRMEKAGLVLRKRDAVDERVSNVYLTEAGRTLSLQLRDLQQDMESIAFKSFSDEEKEVLRGYLVRIMNNLTD